RRMAMQFLPRGIRTVPCQELGTADDAAGVQRVLRRIARFLRPASVEIGEKLLDRAIFRIQIEYQFVGGDGPGKKPFFGEAGGGGAIGGDGFLSVSTSGPRITQTQARL